MMDNFEEKQKKKMNRVRSEKSVNIDFGKNYVEAGDIVEDEHCKVTVTEEEERQEQERFERGVILAAIQQVKTELNIPYVLQNQQVSKLCRCNGRYYKSY